MMKHSNDIPNRLKLARERAGYRSARAFALAHEVPYVTYSQHECGKRRLNPDTLVKYAELLNVSASWILSGEEVHDLFVSDSSDGIVYSNKNIKKNEIDSELFLMLYEDIHEFILANNPSMEQTEEIRICVNFYNVISANSGTNTEKRMMLKNLLRSMALFDKYKNV